MLCEIFITLYQAILFIFYFFYFLFKGKPEWQKSKERACAAATKEKPICCLHSYEEALISTQNGATINKESSSSTTKTTILTEKNVQLSATTSSPVSQQQQQQSKTVIGDTTQSDISSKYKITVDFKGRTGCSHDVHKQQPSKYTTTNAFVKISQSVKRAVTLPFDYTIKALTYCKDGIYSVAGGIRNLFVWKRSAKQQSSIVKTDADEGHEKSLAEQVTEALARQEQRNELKRNFEILVTDTDATGADIHNEKYTEKLSIITEPLKGSAEFYTRTEAFRDEDETGANVDISDDSFIPPPPPPPTGGITPSETNTDLCARTTANGKMLPKGAVAVMPADLMAEASVRIRDIEQKLNESLQKQASSEESGTIKSTPLVQQTESMDTVHTDWAVSNRRLLTRPTEEVKPALTHRSRASRGYRTNGTDDETDINWKPQSRRIVSHSESANDGDATFIFRATKSPEFIPRPTFLPDGGGFYMGESVFTPLPEAEEIRPTINLRASATPSESHMGSRVNTPFEEPILSRSLVNTSFETTQNDYSRPHSRFADAFARPQSRFAQNISKIPIGPNYTYNRYNDNRTVRHRSHTTEPRSENLVQSISRRWPPASNASGVEFTKDNWNVAPSSTTSCRKVMERSVTDKWTTRDESGRVVDEWGAKSWEGESSGLHRRADGTGESWRRAVEVSPQGKTSFYDKRRLYTRDYVIESETKNV